MDQLHPAITFAFGNCGDIKQYICMWSIRWRYVWQVSESLDHVISCL